MLAVVLYHLPCGILEVELAGIVAGDDNDVEAALLEHTLEVALAFANGERARGFVVVEVDGGIFAFLVVVVGTLVLIELELAVGSGVDIQVDELGGFLVAPLYLGTEGDDAAFTHIDGNAAIGGIDDELLATVDEFAAVQVIPAALLGEVNLAVAGLVGGDGAGHKGGAEHPLVGDVEHQSPSPVHA